MSTLSEATPILWTPSAAPSNLQTGKSARQNALRVAWAVLFAAALVVLASFTYQPGFRELGDPTKKAALVTSNASSSNDFVISSNRPNYAEIDKLVLTTYGIEMVLEPHVVNVLRISTPSSEAFITEWDITAVKVISPDTSVEFVNGVSNGTEVGVRVASPANTVFRVQVDVCTTASNECSSIIKMATVKYVRREIRSLTVEDREAYFKAVEKIFTLGMEEGQALYGKKFSSHDVFAGLHDSSKYKYHDNLNFLTSHPAMQIRYESALQAIDEEVTLPYWDFLLDSELGKHWGDSPVYSPDWFGPTFSVNADKDNTAPFLQGRFEGIKRIYDPDYEFPEAYHTLYDYLGIPYSSNREQYVTRSGTTCGYQATQGFANCEHVEECFQYFLGTGHDLFEFDKCVEDYVHANLHTMHAGMWDCQVSWHDFYVDNDDWLDDELLSMLAFHQMDLIIDLYVDGYLTCPDSCDLHQTSPTNTSCSCGPSATLTGINSVADIDAMSSERAFDMTSGWYQGIYQGGYGGKRFLVENTEGDFIFKNMTQGNFDKLNKLVLKTSLFPGAYGDMNSGAAANDPLFWVMHQLFDKATHALRLSPHYNTEKFVWDQDDNGEWGEGWNANTLFKYTDFEPYIGNHHISDSEGALTNANLWSLLAPDGESIGYIYDQLTEWGRCHFDPMMTPP